MKWIGFIEKLWFINIALFYQHKYTDITLTMTALFTQTKLFWLTKSILDCALKYGLFVLVVPCTFHVLVTQIQANNVITLISISVAKFTLEKI